MRNNSITISQSRQYIIVLEHRGVFQFEQVTVPENCKNTSAIATNLFHSQYLSKTPLNEAGIVLATIPIEQLRSSLLLQQLFAELAIPSSDKF